jgi:hypothetical protein
MGDAWLVHALWFGVGFAAGFFAAAWMATAGQCSRDEERRDGG